MGVTSLTKQKGGAALIQNFKNIFPGQIEKLYIYRGTNLLSKGENIIAREDHQTTISLKLIKSVDVIYGGQAYTATPRTVQEEKQIKELTRDIVNSESVTAFIKDLDDINIQDDTIYYTVGNPFIQSTDKNDQLAVLTFNNVVPSLLRKLITSAAQLSQKQKNIITNNKSISFNFTPALLDDTLSSSKMSFVDGDIYKKIPSEQKDFEITSLDISSDHSFLPEYGNWIKIRGILENSANVQNETDIEFKTDKPLLPINLNPYAKKGNLQFAIGNFNKYIYMPWLYAKKFLSDERSIKSYISQGNTAQWVTDLIASVINMFKLSHAFSTNFSEFRDPNGDLKDEKIGDIALKALENKDPVKSVDAIMKNWEYTYPNNINSDEQIRAKQILVASSQYISSTYCISSGLNEFNKSILDFFLTLETPVNKDISDIFMKLGSLRYAFTYEKDADGIDDLTKPIINLLPLASESSVIVDETDRYITLPEIDDPISTASFVTFPGDIDSTKQDSLKYKVGLDITDPKNIADFFINRETSNEEITEKNITVNSDFYVTEKNPDVDGIFDGQTFDGRNVYRNGYPGKEQAVLSSASIPPGAYDVIVESPGTEKITRIQLKFKPRHEGNSETNFFDVITVEGAVVKYKLKTVTHGVKNKVLTYNKGTLHNLNNVFSSDQSFKRTLTINDFYRDTNGIQTVKIKSIDRIYLSFILGNYVDITINYKYKDDQGKEVTGSELLPRIELPSKNDETRTKLGISL